MQAFYQVFRDLTEYVKQYFPSGVVWNAKGKPAKEVMAEVDGKPKEAPAAPPAPAPSAGGPPPPPPPPPPSFLVEDSTSPSAPSNGPSGTTSGLGAVFSDLNKGDAVTKGLRKVDKSEMTHKNPSLRAGATVTDKESPRGKSPAPARKPKPESMRVKKPPKKELEGNKWLIVRAIPTLSLCHPSSRSQLTTPPHNRRTTRTIPSQSRSRRPFHTRSSSASVTRRPSSSRARRTP